MFTGLTSPTHLIILLAIVLLLFGAKRLPELGKSLGQGINEFKEGLDTKEQPEEEKNKEPEALEEEKEKPRAKAAQEEQQEPYKKGAGR